MEYYCRSNDITGITLDGVGLLFVNDTDKRNGMLLNIDEHLFVMQFSW
jgi:hypothetical protein